MILVYPCSKCAGTLRSVRRTAMDSDRFELLCHKCGHVDSAGYTPDLPDAQAMCVDED